MSISNAKDLLRKAERAKPGLGQNGTASGTAGNGLDRGRSGIDDLYVDRLKQATMNAPEEDIHFNSALAVATSRYVDINWIYVAKRIATTLKTEPIVGETMRRVNRRIRGRARRALSPPSPV